MGGPLGGPSRFLPCFYFGWTFGWTFDAETVLFTLGFCKSTTDASGAAVRASSWAEHLQLLAVTRARSRDFLRSLSRAIVLPRPRSPRALPFYVRPDNRPTVLETKGRPASIHHKTTMAVRPQMRYQAVLSLLSASVCMLLPRHADRPRVRLRFLSCRILEGAPGAFACTSAAILGIGRRYAKREKHGGRGKGGSRLRDSVGREAIACDCAGSALSI